MEPGEEVDWKIVEFLFFNFLRILVYVFCFALAKIDGCKLNSNVSCYFEGCFAESGSTESVGDWRSDGDRTIAHPFVLWFLSPIGD